MKKEPTITVRRAKSKDSGAFIELLLALAKFERLEPPSESGKRRLIKDAFVTKRLNLLLAYSNSLPVGYALYFYTYSSFVAKPTLYLEDIFVLENYRGQGVGSRLFTVLVKEARKLRCGRMEWSVLTWNKNAIRFYEKLGAKKLEEWEYYRLDEKDLARLDSC